MRQRRLEKVILQNKLDATGFEPELEYRSFADTGRSMS
jgi:hypothetical protein